MWSEIRMLLSPVTIQLNVEQRCHSPSGCEKPSSSVVFSEPGGPPLGRKTHEKRDRAIHRTSHRSEKHRGSAGRRRDTGRSAHEAIVIAMKTTGQPTPGPRK